MDAKYLNLIQQSSLMSGLLSNIVILILQSGDSTSHIIKYLLVLLNQKDMSSDQLFDG